MSNFPSISPLAASSTSNAKPNASAANGSDLIIVVHGDKQQPELTKLGAKVVQQFKLEQVVSSMEADSVRLFHAPAGTSAAAAELPGVSGLINRIALVHLGKNPIKEQESTAAKQQQQGIFKTPLSQQYAAEAGADDALFEYRDTLRKRVISAFEALQKDSKKATRHVLVEDLDSMGHITADALVYASWNFRLPDQDAADAKKKQQQQQQKSSSSAAKDAAEEDEDASKIKVQVGLLSSSDAASDAGASLESERARALATGDAQNLCRYLAELPGNYMTPTIFCDTVSAKFREDGLSDKVKISAHDEKWAREQGMNLFLSVAQGSDEPPRFLEMEYRGNPSSDAIDIILVGKGVTFDSGGISIKPSEGMKAMRGDMAGAASVVSALYAAARLGLKVNMNVITPLTENMPSGKATKPGDIFRARNQKSVEVDNTDAEGRLILADALCWASERKPRMVVDVATLTGACVIALGHVMAACFSNTRQMWQLVEEAGVRSNDYFWRMPLHVKAYKEQLKSHLADLNNIGGRPAGSCTAAAFLSEFVDFDNVQHWAHLDIAGVSDKSNHMTGRPVRALVELLSIIEEQQQGSKKE